MIFKLAKKIFRRISKRIYSSEIRYSDDFAKIVNLLNYSPREQAIKIGIEFVKSSKIKGDYFEFGSNIGNTITCAYYFAKRNKLADMRFFCFDSFKGLPKIQGFDATDNLFHEGQFKCGLDQFKSNLKRNSVNIDKIHITPGWFEETLTSETKLKLPTKKAAILWIDCDLYESTVPVLNFITDYVQNGTLIYFDDWYYFRGSSKRGEQLAFNQWLNRNSQINAIEYKNFGWHGNSFILSVLK